MLGLYLDLIGAALVGLIAYFWLPQLAGLHHLMVRQILLRAVRAAFRRRAVASVCRARRRDDAA